MFRITWFLLVLITCGDCERPKISAVELHNHSRQANFRSTLLRVSAGNQLLVSKCTRCLKSLATFLLARRIPLTAASGRHICFSNPRSRCTRVAGIAYQSIQIEPRATVVGKSHLPKTLEESIASKIVLEHGRLQPLDTASGAVIRDASMDNIESEWLTPLRAVLAYWRELPSRVPGLHLVSVYARGSIPRGLALHNVSDVDTLGFAVFDGSNEAALASWYEQRRERETSVLQRFPFISGIEMRLAVFPRESTIGQWLLGVGSDSDLPRLDAGDLQRLDAFRLASQGLLLHGKDLVPSLPPPVPFPRLILALRSDLRKVAHSIGFEDPESDSRLAIGKKKPLEVARWVGKRALRAGMELAACSGKFNFFSRDLLPCHSAIAQALGERVARHSLTVLQYSCMGSEEIDKHGGERYVAQALIRATQSLHNELETVFFASHFSVALTDFSRLPEPAPLSLQRTRKSVPVANVLRRALAKIQRSVQPTFDRYSKSEQEENSLLISDPLTPHSLANVGPLGTSRRVLDLNWQTFSERKERIDRIAMRALAAGRRPVLLRGASVDLAPIGYDIWNLNTIPQLISKGNVRVSPDATFIFCREQHSLCRSGLFPIPSYVAQISGEEFVERITKVKARTRNPNLFYGPSERYYMQADVPNIVLDVKQIPPLWRTLGMSQAQPMRLWISTHGSTTPLHWDAAGSFLAQMRGTKRLIFFPPSALPGLYPFPVDHPLHRRSRVPLHGSANARDEAFPKFESIAAEAQEVLLAEGDVIFFPRHWWHSVETTSPLSFSIGCRFL